MFIINVQGLNAHKYFNKLTLYMRKAPNMSILEVYQPQCTGLETKVNSDFINTLLMVLPLCCSFHYQVSCQTLGQYAMPRVYDQMMACMKAQGSDMLILRVSCTFSSDYAKIHFRGISELQKGSLLPSCCGSYAENPRPDLYTKPHKLVSGNKMGESCSTVKIVQSIFARMKGRVLRPV